jgi:teichuronic acid biosynthesis glycosyltransferase TuaC
MRIAFVTTSFPGFPGDPSGHFVETEAKRAALSAEVFVVTAAHDGLAGGVSDRDPRATEVCSVIRLPGHGAFGWPGISSRVRARPRRVGGALRWAWNARRTLETLLPLDRIVAHWAFPSGWPIAGGLAVPVELVSHGADVRFIRALPGPLRREAVDRLLRNADAWRFVSSSLKGELLASLDARDRERVESIARVEACPLEMPDVELEARAKRAAHSGAPLAVCVGRLVPSKRVERIVDFVARELTGTRLVVVGDGPLLPHLAGRARARGVDALFVGQTTRPEALAWIGAADVVLHASVSEGLSTVEREARALGIPFRFVGGVPASSDLR